ncbi:MAG: hypothetical protein EZS28_019852, partial [Streblomastix strix]
MAESTNIEPCALVPNTLSQSSTKSYAMSFNKLGIISKFDASRISTTQSSSMTVKISWLAVRCNIRQDCDDRMEKNRNDYTNTSLDHNNCLTKENQGQLAFQLHKKVELPSLINSERRTPYETTQQIQDKTTIIQRWNSKIKIWKCYLKETYWWKMQILHNQNIRAPIISPQAILRTDASQVKQVATITFLESGLKQMLEQSWNQDFKFNSSNEREAASILQGLRLFAMSPRYMQ